MDKHLIIYSGAKLNLCSKPVWTDWFELAGDNNADQCRVNLPHSNKRTNKAS